MKALKLLAVAAATTSVMFASFAEARGPGGAGSGGGGYQGTGVSSGMASGAGAGAGAGPMRQYGGPGTAQGDQLRSRLRDPSLNPGHEPIRDRDRIDAPSVTTTTPAVATPAE